MLRIKGRHVSNPRNRQGRLHRAFGLPLLLAAALTLTISGCTLFFDTDPGPPPADAQADTAAEPDAGEDVAGEDVAAEIVEDAEPDTGEEASE